MRKSSQARYQVALACVLLAGLAFARSESSEMTERQGIVGAVNASFMQRHFEDLERMAEAVRATKARTPSGVWKLGLFYSGIDELADMRLASDVIWNAIDQEMQAWESAYPESPTPRVARATLMLRRAWSHRGTAYAHEVTPEQWQQFHRYLNQTHAYLETARHVAAVDPEWHVLLLSVAKAQAWPDAAFDALLDAALDQEPYYYSTYLVAGSRAQPRWGGSAGKLEQLARAAITRTNELDGNGVYTRIYWQALVEVYLGTLFVESKVDWATMKSGMDDVLKKYPEPWNANHFASFACFARDRDKTRELLDRVGEQPIIEGWCNRRQYQQCRAWAFASETELASQAVPAPEVETNQCEPDE